MEMHAPSAYPLAKVPRLFLIKMLISDLNSAAVAAVEIQASANRALAGKCCLCSCITVTSCSAGKHALEGSGRNRCKLSTLINNAGNTVREGTAVDTVYYNRSDCHHSCIALAACIATSLLSAEITDALPAVEAAAALLAAQACDAWYSSMETAPFNSSESVT